MADTWVDKFGYLNASRPLHPNDDYWRFLVREVWRLDEGPRRVIDFGCGFGRTGLHLMPLLPAGSTYTGFDRSRPLLAKGNEVSASLPCPARFVQGDVHAAPFGDSRFDVAVAHTVLMHVVSPERVMAEMVRVTRHGGTVITCDASRNAHNALFHIHETQEQDQTPLSLFQAMNAAIRKRTGVDYNIIGMKTPILMHLAGLRDVQARTSDAVRLLFPPVDTPEKERLFRAICDDGFGYCPTDEDGIRKWQARLVEQGVSESDAAAEIQREIDRDFPRKGRQYHTVYAGVLTFSFGTVHKDG